MHLNTSSSIVRYFVLITSKHDSILHFKETFSADDISREKVRSVVQALF